MRSTVDLFGAPSATFAPTAWPRPADPREYDRAIQTYVDRVWDTGAVAGVFQIGGIGDPGISDIDLVVVLRPEIAVATPDAFGIARCSEHDRYLFMHGPFLFDPESAKGLHLHYRIESLRPIRSDRSAEEIFGVDGRGEMDPPRADLAVAVDFGVDLTAQFAQLLATRQIPVRATLCLLHSVRYTVAVAETLGIPIGPGDRAFLEGVARLRAQAFLHTRPVLLEQVIGLVRAGLRLLLRLIGALAAGPLRSALNSEALPPAGGGVFRYKRKYYFPLLEGDFNVERALQDMMHLSRDRNSRWSPARLLNRLVLPLPGELYGHYAAYAAAGGPLGGAISDRLSPMPRVHVGTEYGAVLRAKAALANRQFEFLRSRGFQFGQLLLNSFAPGSDREKGAGGWLERTTMWQLSRRG